MGGRLLPAAVLADDVRAALTLAATRRGDRTLTTAHVLVEVMRVDRDASGWARITLHGHSLDQIAPTQCHDSGGDSPAIWKDAPLSADLAVALEVAGRLADEYRPVPMPTVARPGVDRQSEVRCLWLDNDGLWLGQGGRKFPNLSKAERRIAMRARR